MILRCVHKARSAHAFSQHHSIIPLSTFLFHHSIPHQFDPATQSWSLDEEDNIDDSEVCLDNDKSDASSDSTEGADMSYVLSDTEDENPLFLKCTPSFKRKQLEGRKKDKFSGELIQTVLSGEDIEDLFSKILSLEIVNTDQQQEIEKLLAQIKQLKDRLDENGHSIKGRVERLESKNSLLKEKSIDVRKENDLLVEKLQKLQKKLSMEVRVSVSEYCEDSTVEYGAAQFEEDHDDLFYSAKPASVGTPDSAGRDKTRHIFPKRSSGPGSPGSRTVISEDYLRNEERRFEEAAEKIMRLEQRIVCLQKANNLNSCATCRPLRSHVMKIERQLLNLAQERKGQLEELYELKQEALSSAVGEKDAHLAWLEVSMSREEIENVHTKSTVDRLRRERRDLLHRMKEENENRMKLMSSLDDNSALFTGQAKITSLGALGESYLEEVDSGGLQSTSSLQSVSTGELGELNMFSMARGGEQEGLPSRPFDPSGVVELDLDPEEDKQSTKSC